MLRFVLLVLLALPASVAQAQPWESAAPMATARSGAAGAVLDGRFYVVGGRGSGGELLASAEVFSPADGWASIAPVRDARADAQLVAFAGRLYLLGGLEDDGATDDVEVYDPALDRWEPAERHLERDRAGLMAGVAGGELFVIGGAREGQFSSSAERYDGDRWRAYPTWTLAPARASGGAASTGDALVVAGGFSQFGPVASVAHYVPGAAAAALPDLPSARGGLALVATTDALVAIGGRGATDEPLGAVDRLATGAAAWTPLPSLPEPREGAVAVVVGTDLYVAGGTDVVGSRLATVVRLPGAGVAGDALPSAAPSRLRLDGPNPARGTVHVALVLDAPASVRVTVVDVQGREVAALADGSRPAGRLRLAWDASRAPAGVYAVCALVDGAASVVRVTTVR